MLRRTISALRPKVMSAKEAIADIPDGSSLGIGCFGLCGLPFTLSHTLTGSKVKDLTLVSLTMTGTDCGIGPIVSGGHVKKAITSYIGDNRSMVELVTRGGFEVELLPQGTLVAKLNAAGSGIPALYVPTGYGTDVSKGGLPMRFDKSGNPVKVSEPRETRKVNGRWCVYEEALPIDYSFVRAWKADTRGNLVFRGTMRNSNVAVARASKVCIAEVDEIVEAGQLDANAIHVPGIYVNRLVKSDPALERHEPAVLSRPIGDTSNPEVKEKLRKVANSARHRIARRAALEIKDGMYLNLGFGTPTLVGTYVPKGLDVMLHGENGVLGIGPYPTEDQVDYSLTNAGKETVTLVDGAVLFESMESFAMMRGGHMNMVMIGALEVSGSGDIASWYIPGKALKGMGGAMELVSSGSRAVVLMSHCSKDGEPRIKERCDAPLTGVGCMDVLITELAVFHLEKNASGVRNLVLTEVAEGHDVEEIRAKTGAKFVVSPDLKTMPLAPCPV